MVLLLDKILRDSPYGVLPPFRGVRPFCPSSVRTWIQKVEFEFLREAWIPVWDPSVSLGICFPVQLRKGPVCFPGQGFKQFRGDLQGL